MRFLSLDNLTEGDYLSTMNSVETLVNGSRKKQETKTS